MAFDVRLVIARLLLEANDVQARRESYENVDNRQHGRLYYAPEHQQRKGKDGKTIGG